MSIFDSIILGIVEGLTEFLPVSSTGHLTITEKLLGLPVDSKAVTAYTAVIQMGAIAAVLVYFWRDIRDIAEAWLAGLARRSRRGAADYRLGWYVIIGSIPVGLVGLLAKDVITGPLRSLWWVAGALIVWSAVMVLAEHRGSQQRDLSQVSLSDAVLVGLAQCVSLVPGISRSGATISVGLLAGLDRVTATRLSFFLSIPALTAAGLYELKDVIGSNVGIAPTVVGTAVSFVVAYAAIAWLLRFVAGHSIVAFVPYRVALGCVLLALLGTGVMTAT
ncbi:MAG TPA: undecaprenyl-diphosphate phosphatase [Aeromicrobium sp.]|nr:undecaprenyl-diphosphate phosphatase [Aeromicrobium sp.]